MSASYTSPFQLSLIIDGPGNTPDAPSHWSLALHPPSSTTCTLLQVLPLANLPPERLIHEFDRRENVKIFNRDPPGEKYRLHPTTTASEGRIVLAKLTTRQYRQLIHTIQKEAAPTNGKEGCQEWCVNAVINLEVDEFVEPGTSEWVDTLRGLSSQQAKKETLKRGAVKGGVVLWVDAKEEKGKQKETGVGSGSGSAIL